MKPAPSRATKRNLVAKGGLKSHGCSSQELWGSISKFTSWLETVGYESYDPYDVWGTRYGLWARRLYYQKNLLGTALVGPLMFTEWICPLLRKWLVRKARYATADAQLILAFLNLHQLEPASGVDEATEVTENQPRSPWLNKARDLAKELLEYSVRGYSGYCWGYPFDWQNVNGFTKKGTPFITTTPYCFEAFLKLADISREGRYLEIAQSVAAFVHNDLIDTPTGKDAAAGSYGPYLSSKVVNASAYRAYVLMEAAHRFGLESYKETAQKNLRFVLQNQRSDGSWLYAIDNPAEAFIDHFHTCFVLKNLWKINERLKDARVSQAIRQGFAYYRQELFDTDGLPKSFAIQPRLQMVRLELYNFAEAISLGAQMKDDVPEALTLACRLTRALMDRYQLPEGHFVTRVYRGGLKHTVPFLRWPQAQLLYALTNVLRSLASATPRESASLRVEPMSA